VAATVRAIGEGMSAAYHARLAIPPSAELVSALAFAARGAPSPVAMAAVDSLGHAHRAGAASAIDALAAAVDHPDEDVVKAALLKLADSVASPASLDGGYAPKPPLTAVDGLARALSHPSPGVRVLAVESLGERVTEIDEARAALGTHLAVEQDRRVVEAIRRVLSLASPVHDPRPLAHDAGAAPKPSGSSPPTHPADSR
jgi:HEAT repeat protein